MSSHHARVPVPATEDPTAALATATPADTTTEAPVRRSAEPLVPAPVSGVGTAARTLTVGHAADPAEHAADALADAALSRLSSSPEAHRHDPGCGHLRRSAAPAASGGSGAAPTVGYEGGDLDASTTSRIESRRGGGAPLPGGVRRRMETAFGTGLGHVRVHDGPDAAALSASISADAFTTGSDIFFGAGRFAPDSPMGERMLAHEIAHVVTEGGPAVHRWPWSKKLTPAEQADKDRKKAEEKAEAEAVKKSKKTEKTEKAQLSQSRAEGVQARAQHRDEVYAGGREAAQAKVTDLYTRMSEAREREFAVFEEMQSKGLGGSDDERARLVFQQVWYVEYPDLTKYRPARETPAEVLVAQVRTARSGAQPGETATQRDAEVVKERMLPATVEKLYDRMVVVRDELLTADPDASEFLVMEEARERVLAGLGPEALAELPPKDGPLDQAAWMAAARRGAARTRQAERDAENVKANLMLLDPSQRLTPQTESAPVGTKVGETLETVGKYGGLAMTGIDKVGGGIAGKVGGKKDDELRQHLPKDDDPSSPVPKLLDPLGVGEAYTTGAKADKMRKAGQRDEVDKNLPTSDATKASAGIGNVTSILSSLFSAVQSALGMAQQIEASWTTNDPYEGLKAAKSGSAMLTGLVNASKEAANLAKTIDFERRERRQGGRAGARHRDVRARDGQRRDGRRDVRHAPARDRQRDVRGARGLDRPGQRHGVPAHEGLAGLHQAARAELLDARRLGPRLLAVGRAGRVRGRLRDPGRDQGVRGRRRQAALARALHRRQGARDAGQARAEGVGGAAPRGRGRGRAQEAPEDGGRRHRHARRPGRRGGARVPRELPDRRQADHPRLRRADQAQAPQARGPEGARDGRPHVHVERRAAAADPRDRAGRHERRGGPAGRVRRPQGAARPGHRQGRVAARRLARGR
ncbi:eCIS core domain-containing protein [Cellulomonas persica]